MKNHYICFLLLSGIFNHLTLFAQVMFPPPNSLEVDNQSLLATWNKPHALLLSQNFEGTVFPPPGWQTYSEGAGWSRAQTGSQYFEIPPHSWFAVSNDDQAGQSNNACCDLLITPSLNLTQLVNGKLKFYSFFDDFYGGSAEVLMSSDDGTSWNSIKTLTQTASWQLIEIDLSSYCGAGGLPSVKFAFHYSDNYQWASGWAIDDVIVDSDSVDVVGYNFYCNDSLISFTDSLSLYIPASLAHFGDSISTKVNAVYPQGVSGFIYYSFISNFLPPPENFYATTIDDSIVWSWSAPADTANLESYMIYYNQEPVAELDKSTGTYSMINLFPGEYCLEITAKYDLTAFGYNGYYAESLKVTDCDSVITNAILPFSETWDSASFNPGQWDQGENWGITITNKSTINNYSARFSGYPLMNNYSSSLESQPLSDIYPLTETPYKIILEFDVACTCTLNNGTENFFVELFLNGQWQLLDNFRNDSSFTWNHEHFDITDLVNGQFFKFRFTACGDNSSGIQGWFIDNISVKRQYSLVPPQKLSAYRKWTLPYGSELTWSPPLNIGGEIQYKLDDNSFEDYVSYYGSGEYWIGNIYTSEVPARLNSASVSMELSPYNTGSTYSIDVFNADRQLIGSSGPFVPVTGQWTDVVLPGIQISGSFYMMLHIITNSESDYLLLDENGPQTSGNKTWVVMDDGVWYELTYYSFDPSVAAIRATGIIGMSDVSYSNSNSHGGYNSEDTTGNPESNFLTPLYYKIYRTVWFQLPPYDTLVSWQFYDTTSVCHYIDYHYWNCGKLYATTAVYTEGESALSNLGFIPPYTDIPDKPSDNISLFPNPACNIIHVKLSSLFNEIELINTTGISELKISVINQSEITLDISHVPPGNYLLVFRKNNGEQVFKKVVIYK